MTAIAGHSQIGDRRPGRETRLPGKVSLARTATSGESGRGSSSSSGSSGRAAAVAAAVVAAAAAAAATVGGSRFPICSSSAAGKRSHRTVAGRSSRPSLHQLPPRNRVGGVCSAPLP